MLSHSYLEDLHRNWLVLSKVIKAFQLAKVTNDAGKETQFKVGDFLLHQGLPARIDILFTHAGLDHLPRSFALVRLTQPHGVAKILGWPIYLLTDHPKIVQVRPDTVKQRIEHNCSMNPGGCQKMTSFIVHSSSGQYLLNPHFEF